MPVRRNLSRAIGQLPGYIMETSSSIHPIRPPCKEERAMPTFKCSALTVGAILSLAVGLAIALPAPTVWAMGSSSDSSSTSPTTTANFASAKKLVDDGQYRDAIPILEQ